MAAKGRLRLVLALAAGAIALPLAWGHFRGCAHGPARRAGPAIHEIEPGEFEEQVRRDARTLRVYATGLEATVAHAEGASDVFAAVDVDLPLDKKARLRAAWRGFLDYAFALDAVKARYAEFHRVNAVTRRTDHAHAFLIAYAAWLAQYEEGLRFVNLTIGRPVFEAMLDEEDPAQGVPRGSFASLKWNVVHVAEVSRLYLGQGYLKALEAEGRLDGVEKDEDLGWALGYVHAAFPRAQRTLKEKSLEHFSYNAYDIVRDEAFAAWFPAQTAFAEWAGDTKLRRLKRNLITEEQAREMARELRPGDVIVERRNWFLSNVGLPGFWPHAELFCGALDDLDAYFADAEGRAALDALPGKPATASAYLRALHPTKLEEYARPAPGGSPHRIIEAVSEGVVFSAIEEACGADYVAAMRPRLGKGEKLRALAEAFGHAGKPYDFDFDFFTDSRIVCTELVYKAYKPGGARVGLSLPLIDVLGHHALPANDIVRTFDEEYGTERQQLDFVCFLDGREAEGRAVRASVEEFRASHRRPKWDVLQR